ncbi:hypothetical protein PPSIR1_19904 [Plesiocystis pacifica SIR-1]|uniref:DUF2330 domain-containing protein n=1 Tax=Plesiocystis pacifica SIR-1 TaxID=391625 RepID=A6GDT3_9BACT|nr:DUF2330 domain-containing protein [Plesiocystis pacifica]EDM75972.1 hypothetical protein PPSIR1_19904 [Plesiocystis pacifica SIR-1]
MKTLNLAPLAATAALAGALLLPNLAQACGGTFCDQGPQAMPVDQTGENILFHIGDGFVEAHIQIQYDPDAEAEQFAWVIPVTAIPTFSVGSDNLFSTMLNASVPSYGLTVSNEFCGEETEDGWGGDDLGEDEAGSDEGTDGGNGNPNVVLETTVGAFEIAVLDGGTVEGVMTWLNDNGYQQDPAAEPILGEYLADGHLFVALKLTNDAEVSEIHPVTLRYDGDESCVPIKLTRIAAVENMDIRVFFLQDARTVPVNYRHVLVNPLKIDWFNNAANYKEVITMAVDADMANGNAFVTEYAGPSSVINRNRVHQLGWDPSGLDAFADSPVGVIEALEGKGILECDLEWNNECIYNHPLLRGMLQEFIPAPEGVDESVFYDCMSCYEEDVDLAAWDAAAFAERMQERITDPGLAARALLDENSYLTRMYTTISPAEMMEDPIFRINDTLPEVQRTRIASQNNLCNGVTEVTLPDGRVVAFDNPNPVWPEFPDEMPWEEDVDQESMAENAPLINLVDNTDLIDQMLAEHNEKARANAIQNAEGGSCTCSASDEQRGGHGLFGLAILGALGLGLRRRR